MDQFLTEKKNKWKKKLMARMERGNDAENKFHPIVAYKYYLLKLVKS